ncbi:Protein STICHEL-like 3, partial [Camellia lanceoleosa]
LAKNKDFPKPFSYTFPQGRDVSDSLLKREIDSDLASKARFGDQQIQNNFRRQHNSRHQNLTQKYMPITFRDLVRALNCQSLDQPKPCRYCNACIAYDMGKSRNIREVGLVSNFYFDNIIELLDNMIISQLPSQYRVFIFDDCDTLSLDCWNAILKVIDREPRCVAFVLVSSSLEIFYCFYRSAKLLGLGHCALERCFCCSSG